MDLTPPIPPAPYRRLTLLDIMGLVVACGLGLAGFATVQTEFRPGQRWPVDEEDWCGLVWVILLMLAGLVVVGGLRRPRPERREPGYLTAASILVGSVFAALTQWNWLLKPPSTIATASIPHQALIAYLSGVFFGPPVIGAAVAATWLGSAILGAWRQSGGALNRLGLLLGGASLTLLLVVQIFFVWT